MKNNKYIYVLILVFAGISLQFNGCGDSKSNKTGVNGTGNNKVETNKPETQKTEINKTETYKSESTKMIHLTAAEFKQKVFNYETEKDWKFIGDKPVIIDFYADWCGPCKMVAPVLEELSKEYDGKVQIYKVDTETEQELASVFGIRSIPSILFIPKEGKPQMSTGAMQKAGFIQAINEILLVN